LKTAADLKKGEKGIIRSFSDQEMSLKLLEMGCLPGTELLLTATAPFGDPIVIKISGYCLSMRRNEAATILIE
jgi:ferrous iron transport protein A